jgi:cyclic dehypoxanthinyl futalosine synthase
VSEPRAAGQVSTEGEKLRIAGVGYLNAAPLVHGLADDPGIELALAPPREVARRLAEGEADVALIPVAAVFEQGGLELLDLGVSADGPVRSVVLVASRPFEEIREVLLDASSRTSVVLARVVLAWMGLTPRFVRCEPAEAIARAKGNVAALVIGDPAIDLADRFPHSIDLAAAWKARTGLPFVFAAWAVRRGALRGPLLERLYRAADEGEAAAESIARDYAASKGEPADRFVSYLTRNIRHRLGMREREGLLRFSEEAAKLGLLPPIGPEAVFPAGEELEGTSPQSPSARRPATVDALLRRAMEGGRLSGDEALRVYREAELFALGMAADAVRKRKVRSDVVTYIVDRNVNYTNVCTTSCRFCAFYRPPGHGEGWTLSREQLGEKLQEVVDAGGVQILLQGGLNPALRIEWYEDLFRWIKGTYGLGLHALSPEEILYIGQLEGLSTEQVLRRLHAAGLDSVPGGGAEILVDRVRRQIAKAKCTSDEWLSVMRVAHHMGLRSSATMMYGTLDRDVDRVLHLLKLRELQDETGGFTAFFCWDFQYEQGTRIAPGDHGTVLYLRTQALARLVLDNFDHVGSSWVTQGPAVGQIALRFGADDWGSVMFEENVVSSAGTTFRMNAGTIERQIHQAGFKHARRDVRYTYLTEPT